MAGELASVVGSTVRLRDGSVVVVREIQPSDADALVRFHEGLSPDAIRMRYFSAHPHLSQVETVRLTTVDHRDRQAYIAEAEGAIVGVARYERSRADGEAEVAFLVTDAWQGRGLGGELLRRLVDHARSCGFHRFTASTLAHNRPMLAVFTHAGLPIAKRLDSGVVDLVLDLD
jgi:RimJ/RimL family protein N-acetyltransferase